jgi:seryl-tRNA synthetase
MLLLVATEGCNNAPPPPEVTREAAAREVALARLHTCQRALRQMRDARRRHRASAEQLQVRRDQSSTMLDRARASGAPHAAVVAAEAALAQAQAALDHALAEVDADGRQVQTQRAACRALEDALHP